MKVDFPLLGKEIEVEPGARVSDACELAGVPLNLVCGGNGTCNKCRVDIVEDGQKFNVLGCQHRVSDGLQVLVTAEKTAHQLLESVSTRADYEFMPHIHDILLETGKLVTPMGGYDYSRLSAVIREEAGVSLQLPSYDILQTLSRTYRGTGKKFLNVVLAGRRIIDLVPADTRIPFYAVAVDIGTTSVVAFLYNMTTGRLLGHCSDLNAQHVYGADVISRIEHCAKAPGNLAAEQRAVQDTVNGLIAELCEQEGIAPESIYEVAYCGNSTMQHLFFAFDPYPLGRSPFTGLVSEALEVPASRFDIHINPNGVHVFMPLLGGFVGADTTACLLELPHDRKMRMMIDLGTNCEVALGIDTRMMVASTACGPALEGAGISMGMRAVEGAIESVDYDEETGSFAVGVIGDAAPTGFCGSGIIDMVAVLCRLGLVNRKGTFLKGSKRDAHPLGSRIRESEEKGRYFVLVEAEDNPNGTEISMTLKDIRAIQLAKSAIYTGCTILMRSYGIEPRDIAEICLAGAFGNYIDIENAQQIGLIPRIPGVPVRSLGNAAGLGVQRYLLSRTERERAGAIAKHTTHVELANDPSFTEVYLQSMSFEVNLME